VQKYNRSVKLVNSKNCGRLTMQIICASTFSLFFIFLEKTEFQLIIFTQKLAQNYKITSQR